MLQIFIINTDNNMKIRFDNFKQSTKMQSIKIINICLNLW